MKSVQSTGKRSFKPVGRDQQASQPKAGFLITDGLEQYHKLERDLTGVKNANCMAHARRHFANAIKATGKSNPKAVESSVAYEALVRIGAIYDLEGALKELAPEERLKERQASIKPLVEEFLKAFSRSAMESFKRSLSNPLLLAYC